MKKKDLTELVFILDKSGSMSGKELDVIGGFNSTIASNKDKDYECLVTTTLFSDKSKTIHDRISIKEVDNLSENEYQVGGCTALIDTIGNTIKHIENIHKYQNKKDLPNKVLFVIMTDGLENASSKYSSDEVKRMIEQKKELDWEFLFMGANIDAVETAKVYGIKKDRAVNFINDSEGIDCIFDAVSDFTGAFFGSNVEMLQKGTWRAKADKNYEKRSKN